MSCDQQSTGEKIEKRTTKTSKCFGFGIWELGAWEWEKKFSLKIGGLDTSF